MTNEDDAVRESLAQFLLTLTPGRVTETVIVDAFRHAWGAGRRYEQSQPLPHSFARRPPAP